ncbi:MAG: Hsp20/alpha crystallin family protein [Planctomyces sp.]|nr:Hsp20/alpha crystallin family protein [Planctomyces sp.]
MKTNLPGRVSSGFAGLMNRDPVRALRSEMNELFGRFSDDWGDGGWMTEFRAPSMDLAETDKEIEVKVDVPGLKPEEINVEVQNNVLVISGEHREEKEEQGKTFHRIERRSGSLQRSITLPCAVQENKIVAQCRDGVLTITLPKAEEACRRKIPVKG